MRRRNDSNGTPLRQKKGGWKSNPLLLVVVLVSHQRHVSACGRTEASAAKSAFNQAFFAAAFFAGAFFAAAFFAGAFFAAFFAAFFLTISKSSFQETRE